MTDPDVALADAGSVFDRRLLPTSIAIYTIVALAAFEGLAVAAALPEVAADLGSVGLLPWVITGFLLFSGVATVVSGPLIDRLGVGRMLRYSVALFTITGTACAFAPTMETMIGLRALQGAGAGTAIAVGLAAVSESFPDHLVGRAYAANSTVWGVMGVAGPAIAAVLLTTFSWRSIFILNLPLGLVSLAFGWRALPIRAPDEGARNLDLTGVALVLAFNSAVLVASDRLGPWSIPFVAIAVAAGWLYLRHARRAAEPVMATRHLAAVPFAPLGLTIGLLIAGAIAANTYLPVYVRAGRGGSTALAAWSVLWFTVGWTAGANIAGRITHRIPESLVVRTAVMVTAPTLVVLAVASGLDAPLPVMFGLLFVAATGIGASTNAGLTLLRTLANRAEMGRSIAAHQFYRNLGFAVGAALGGAILLLVTVNDIGDLEMVRRLLDGDAATSDPAAAAAVRAGYTTTIWVGAAIAASALIPAQMVRKHLVDRRRQARYEKG